MSRRPAPIFDAAGRQAIVCGACKGSGLVPEGSIAVAGDIARVGDRCTGCDGSGISRWEWPPATPNDLQANPESGGTA